MESFERKTRGEMRKKMMRDPERRKHYDWSPEEVMRREN
jgi:hypothetical protein